MGPETTEVPVEETTELPVVEEALPEGVNPEPEAA